MTFDRNVALYKKALDEHLPPEFGHRDDVVGRDDYAAYRRDRDEESSSIGFAIRHC